MADSQGEAYVRRDVFEARMDRMEMLLEKTVLEIKSYVDKSTGETKTYVEKTAAETKAYVEKTTAETKDYVDNALTEIKTEIAGIKGDIKALTTRVDVLEQTLGARMGAVESTLSWWIALFAAIIALTTFLPPVLAFFKNVLKPPFTLEEIRSIVRAEIANQSGGGE